jgi:hypothetical protein
VSENWGAGDGTAIAVTMAPMREKIGLQETLPIFALYKEIQRPTVIEKSNNHAPSLVR